MAALAIAAAAGAVLLTGTVSALFPDSAGIEASRFAAEVEVPSSADPRAGAPAAEPRPDSAPASSPHANEWQVQLGAFERQGAAEEHLRWLSARVPGLDGKPALLQPAGAMTRLRVAGLGSARDARLLCARVRAAGVQCFLIAPD